ncbi:MAG: type 4a pilus biogenesis protein PilO [Candidatus Omnitrophota bacterium]
MMLIKQLAVIYNNWYGKLKKGEQRLFLIFVFVLAASFYFALFLKPALNDISKMRKKLQENQNQLGLLDSQLPSSATASQEIEAIRREIKELKLHISDIESKLIGASQEQYLLAEVIKNAQSLGVDLESVKEDVKEDKEGFGRLYIDLEFSSDYGKAVTYIKRIESISPFVRMDEMRLGQSKNDLLSTINVSLRLSALLSYASNNRGQLSLSAKEPGADDGVLKRSPFTPKFVVDKTKRKKLKVTGIAYRESGASSTAIINGLIVKAGDQVDWAKIERILPNSVVINSGAEKEVLKLER